LLRIQSQQKWLNNKGSWFFLLNISLSNYFLPKNTSKHHKTLWNILITLRNQKSLEITKLTGKNIIWTRSSFLWMFRYKNNRYQALLIEFVDTMIDLFYCWICFNQLFSLFLTRIWQVSPTSLKPIHWKIRQINFWIKIEFWRIWCTIKVKKYK
jgi:hypothetical protein